MNEIVRIIVLEHPTLNTGEVYQAEKDEFGHYYVPEADECVWKWECEELDARLEEMRKPHPQQKEIDGDAERMLRSE